LWKFLTVALLLTPTFADAQQSAASTTPWSGAYGGVIAGLAIHRAATATTVQSPGAYFITTDPSQIVSAGQGAIAALRGIAGVRAGYDVHRSRLVVGLAIDVNAMPVNAVRSVTTRYQSFPATFTTTQSIATNWLLTVRPRIGRVARSSLIYATGGLAVADPTYSSTFTDLAYAASEYTLTSRRARGWAIGGVVERAWRTNWTFTAEYLLVRLLPTSASGGVSQTRGDTAVRLLDFVNPTVYAVRAVLKYGLGVR